MMTSVRLCFALLFLHGCGQSDSSGTDDSMAVNSGGAASSPDAAPGGMSSQSPPTSAGSVVMDSSDGAPPPPLATEPVQRAVTVTLTQNRETHIIAFAADGSEAVRLTPAAGAWSYHAMSPSGRYVAAVKHAETQDDGRPDLDTDAELWVIDLKEKAKNADGTILTDNVGRTQPLTYALSPVGCNAGIGGVGWVSETTIAFAMSCTGEPSKAYLGSITERSRTANNFLVISTHDGSPVREVNPATGSPFFAYVVDQEFCLQDVCVTKPSIWVGDTQNPSTRCGISDGDRQNVALNLHTGVQKRVGDAAPALGPRLDTVTFVRNVRSKSPGPTGHFDMMHVDINRQTLFNGGDRCDVPGTLRNLSDEYGDEYPLSDEMNSETAREYFAQYAIGSRAPQNTILYIARVGSDGDESSRVYLADTVTGTKTPLTDNRAYAVFARWFIDEYDLSGGSR